MSWNFVAARERFFEFAPAWDKLNGQLFRGHPLLDSRFVGPLVKYFASEKELLALHGANDSMLLLSPGRRGIWQSFLPSQTQVAPILADPGLDLPDLTRRLPGTALVLELLCQDPEYSAFQTESLNDTHEVAPHAVTLNIALNGDFESYWKSRSKKLRQNISRMIKRLDKEGIAPRLEVVSSPSQLEQALDRYGEIENQGWKGKQGTAIHKSNIQGQFYLDILKGFGEQGRAMVYELYLGDRLSSSQIGIANDFMLITLKTTFDESLRNYSPGRLMDYFLLDYEFGRKQFSVVEYYTNATPELLSWGTGQRTINHIMVYRSAWIKHVTRIYRYLKKNGGRKPNDDT